MTEHAAARRRRLVAGKAGPGQVLACSGPDRDEYRGEEDLMSVMTAPTSSMTHLTWAARRYSWLFALTLLGGIAAGNAAYSAQEPVYEAEALIVAQQLSLDPKALPGYAGAVFSSGAVARAVGADPALRMQPETLIPDKLEVRTAPDSVAVQVVGRDPDPDTASRLTNAAAGAFVIELNRAGPGIGSFALQDRASIPAEPVAGAISLPVALAAGAVAGAVLGAGVVVLLLVARRPVVVPGDAEQVAGVPSFGLVELPRLESGRFPGPRGVLGVATITRGVLETAPSALLITSPATSAPARRRISVMLAVSLSPFRVVETRMAPELEAAVDEHRRARQSAIGAPGRAAATSAPLLVVDGAEPLDVMDYEDHSRCTLLVVRQGTPSQVLRRLVSQYLEGELDGVVLYRTTRRRAPDSTGAAAAQQTPAEVGTRDGDGLVPAPRT